jgi:ribonuclease P protein component
MQKRYAYPKSRRLTHAREFEAVYDGKTKESRGPIVIFAIPNELGHPRLGLSVSRRVGTAVKRNRIKRLIREAFRLMQHDLPSGYDLVVVVRPHEPLLLADYQKIMSGLLVKLHGAWAKRQDAGETPSPR